MASILSVAWAVYLCTVRKRPPILGATGAMGVFHLAPTAAPGRMAVVTRFSYAVAFAFSTMTWRVQPTRSSFSAVVQKPWNSAALGSLNHCHRSPSHNGTRRRGSAMGTAARSRSSMMWFTMYWLWRTLACPRRMSTWLSPMVPVGGRAGMPLVVGDTYLGPGVTTTVGSSGSRGPVNSPSLAAGRLRFPLGAEPGLRRLPVGVDMYASARARCRALTPLREICIHGVRPPTRTHAHTPTATMVVINAMLVPHPREDGDDLEDHELSMSHLPLVASTLAGKPVLNSHQKDKRIGKVVSASVERDRDGRALRLRAKLHIDDEFAHLTDELQYASLGHNVLQMGDSIVGVEGEEVSLVGDPGRLGCATWKTTAANAMVRKVMAACRNSDAVDHVRAPVEDALVWVMSIQASCVQFDRGGCHALFNMLCVFSRGAHLPCPLHAR